MGAGRVAPRRLLFWRNTSTTSWSTTPISRRFFGVPHAPRPKAQQVRSPPGNSNPSTVLSNGSLFSRYFRSFRFNSSKSSPTHSSNPTPNLGSPEPAPSLSQRLRKLSREYGWSAVGVYFALSALDFPFCFMGVRMLGVDRIGHYEHVVLEAFWKVVHVPFPNLGKGKGEAEAVRDESGDNAMAREGQLGWSGDVEAAQERNRGAEASIWTQLALAYAIHKSFIFIRVPLTAAVTPKVVKTLRGWGWDIGKRKPKTK